ncbi:carbamoyl-phosphate synthase large subunit [Candidatus Nitrospira inopinata]|jgi:carbamoyl-phosphate synthase large subunit|uniref:Carbamoyl phosphate synthase large chain n=1 Tax=Candidatus Nitrospira inopinata TaxID=1715989 RepID=A0A0S4KX98_9BACT|nr:carbamoyl-phosphate synthase large subunit [Candidatus Nitrospira inopinata]CUQ67850.1 carbamoyl-phosphate synthase, large subunit [Candidatus Nitrospira inopinata]
MPKRTDIRSVLIIGSGPIVIGQACEFDYSGTQACKALKEEGYRVILINSNPATIMTDPEMADRTYVEPITVDVVEAVIERERPDALLPTMGGQTALNTTMGLVKKGVLDKYGVKLIGASAEAIHKAEDREAFKAAMQRVGLRVPKSGTAHSRAEATALLETVGFPAIIRPSFTMGGTGGNIAYNREEFVKLIDWALAMSPVSQVLIEESVIGWKEYELEVMRDLKDNVVIVCPIENLDPMGVHTGDSITVAPAMTLTDKEYQRMRDAALTIIREIGVETGGSNIQFGVNPENGDMVVIEMNPRVSRSSALASKATGFPIAKIAAKLAVGYTLDEITNDITGVTKASFEPAIDYVVVKIPRFAFQKFKGADPTLTTQMKSVGEAMAIGRTFKEALQKAIRSLELELNGLASRMGIDRGLPAGANRDEMIANVRRLLRAPLAERLWYLADGIRLGLGSEELFAITKIDPWFIEQVRELVEFERGLVGRAEELAAGLNTAMNGWLWEAKRLGFSDDRIGRLLGVDAASVRRARMGGEKETPSAADRRPVTYKRVDTCAAEFEAHTPYLYSTYGSECEARPSDRKKVMILGGGPNRIGQGIEFDYCCVHAAMALREEGVETIMVNCNPETVSTDYDTSDRLYFEPLTEEDVLNIVRTEQPMGVVLQFGGQTPLKLALPLSRAGVRILGTSPDAIDLAEDRERFRDLLMKLGLRQAESGMARSLEEADRVAEALGYPVMVRPSYVLGGRSMQIVYDHAGLMEYMKSAVKASPDHPVLIDKYLSDAIEVDADAISDGKTVVVAGIMEHIEEAGVHSGDSACSLPVYTLDKAVVREIERQMKLLAKALGVVGLMNAQFAVKNGTVYILEVNPRGSRTVPFVSKAIGVPLTKLAMKVMLGRTLDELGFTSPPQPAHMSVKEAVFPFTKFAGVDVLLGPEMKSTGEVMGIDEDFGWAFAKSQAGAGAALPKSGTAFISVRAADRPAALEVARRLRAVGFHIQATTGTAHYLREHGVEAAMVNKVSEGRPHIVDHIKNGEVALVVNTVQTASAHSDSISIRREALQKGLSYYTTMRGAMAAVLGIEAIVKKGLSIRSLQEYHRP